MNEAPTIETSFEWQGRTIRLCYTRLWLRQADHVEIQAVDGRPLPITETGYRSYFFGPVDDTLTRDELIEFVRRWLDRTANDPAWKRFVERSRQGELF